MSALVPFSDFSIVEKLSSSGKCYKVTIENLDFFAKITSVVANNINQSQIDAKIHAYKNISYQSVIPFLYGIKGNEDQVGYASPFGSSNLKDTLTSLDTTEKTISLYGFACALKYLKDKQIIPTNLNGLEKIVLDGNKHPHLSAFYFSELEEITYDDNDFLVPPEVSGSQSIKESSLPYIFGAYAFLIMSNKNSKDQVQRQPDMPSDFPENFKNTLQQCLGSEIGRPSIDEIITKFNDSSFLFPNIDINKFKNYQSSLGNSTNQSITPISQNENQNQVSGLSSTNPLENIINATPVSSVLVNQSSRAPSQKSNASPRAMESEKSDNVISPQSQIPTFSNPTTSYPEEQYITPDYVADSIQPTPMDYANPYQANVVNFGYPVGQQISPSPDVQSIISDAKNGNPDAMFVYGKLLYDGQSVPQNLHKAAYYFKQAGKRGNASGEFFYGMLLENGHGVEQNMNKAVAHYCKAAHLGSADGHYKYGLFLDKGYCVAKSREGATNHFRIAAELGHPLAMYHYGYALAKGRGLPSANLHLGAEYVKRAADFGVPSAQSLYGYMLLKAIGVDKNEQLAYNYIKMAADKQYPPALNLYGEALISGKFTTKDPKKALELFEKASSLGDQNALNNVGRMYELGLGVDKKDEEKAAKCYFDSAESGNIQAMVNLGNCFFQGVGVKEDQSKASLLFDFAASHNNVSAMIFSGICKENGFGTKRNEKEAYQMFEKAADLNNCAGLYHKGRCLLEGIGVKKDKNQATEVLKYAADLGSDRARELLNSI